MAQAENRNTLMAVLYDELIRKHWEEMCGKKKSFRVSSQVGEVQNVVLNRARVLVDKLLGSPSDVPVFAIADKQ